MAQHLVRFFSGNSFTLKLFERDNLPEGAVSTGPGDDGNEEFCVGSKDDVVRFLRAKEATRQMTGK